MPFDHLTRFVIHNFRSLSRLCGPRSPLGLDKLASSHELPAIYTNHAGARDALTGAYRSHPATPLAAKRREGVWRGLIHLV
jgi:hypothetical protein